MDKTILKYYASGDIEVKNETVGDRTLQEAVFNIRDRFGYKFNGWEHSTLKLFTVLRIKDTLSDGTVPLWHRPELYEGM